MNMTWRKSVGTVSVDVYRTQSAAPGCAKLVKVFFLSISLIVLGTWGSGAMAANCTASTAAPQPRNWSAAATWSCGHVPANGDRATIPSGATVILDVNTNLLNDLNVNAGGVLRGDNTNKILNIDNGGGSDITNNGTIDFGEGKLATIFLRQSSQWSGNAGTWNLSTINLNARTLTFSAGSTFTVNMSGAATPFLNAGIVTSLSTVTWNFTGSVAQTLPASANVRYGNVTVSNTAGTTLGVNLTTTNILGNLTVASNGILNNGGFSTTLNAGKNFVMQANTQFNLTGTSTMVAVSGAGTRTFDATSTVNYGGANQVVTADAYGNLTLSGSGTKTMPATAMTVAGDFSMSGTATATAAAAITVGSNVTIGAGATFNAGAFNHTVSGNWNSAGTFNAGTGTVTLDGTAVQTISGTDPVSFNNLTVTNATLPNITLATNVLVTGTLSGTVTLTSTCPIDYTLTSNGGATVLHSCPGPDHILITHAGSALTCSPQTVTITACANSTCTAPHFPLGASVTLTPGGQTFAIDATGINSAASVQQSAAGAVTLDATSVPAAINATTCWNTATATASCAMTFNDSGFLVTVPGHVSCNSAAATIEAVEKSPGTGRCVPAYQNVTRAVNLYSSYANPATGTQVVTASTGVVSTAAPGTAHSLAFDVNGKATITLSYPDAGQLTLTAGDTAPTGAAMTGSGSFVVAPASFVFSGIPAAPLTAGQPFNATVAAMNACGTPAATPNFDGTVTITSTNPQPGLGNATLINTTLSGFVNGAASLNLTWDEVGTIDLNANLANYLGSGLAVTGTQTNVGRFQPSYFDTAVTQGCSTFTYAGSTTPVKTGQPFTVTVTAKEAAGGITKNYDGATYAYATTLSNAGATAGFAGNTIAATSFVNGEGSANVTYEVATPQTAPLTLTLRAVDADTPAVSSSGHTEGTTEMRSGRAKLSNAHGSELLALPVPFRAEYWNSGWLLNPADICSGNGLSGGTVSVALSALPVTCVQDSGNPGLSGAGCAAAGPAGQQFKEGGVAGFAGNFNLWLKAPGAGNTGAVTVTGNVPSWLQYPWGGGAVFNPTVRATFGVYKGANELIYMRENY